MRNRLLQLATLLCCFGTPHLVSAQPTLNGATLFYADGNGSNLRSLQPLEYWGSARTNPGVVNSYANFFLTPNADAGFSAGSFFNNGLTSLSRQLTVGLNTVYFYASGADPFGAPPNFGLNLWFGTGAQSNCGEAPLISALALTATSTWSANNSAFTPSQCLSGNGQPTAIQGANTLSTFTGGYTVTLQSFQNLQLNRTVGGTTIDRVSQTTLTSDQIKDNYGVFTLNVSQPTPTSSVPEPSTYLLMASGLAGIALVSRRQRQKS